MREILFRAKRDDDGKWFEGDLRQFRDGVYIESFFGDGKINMPVFPETVGQFTGLTDKNGTKIFEGDIVKDEYILGKVVYNTKQEDFDGAASFMIDDVDDGLQSYRFWNSVEVIGNIHDNPELRGGE